MELIQAAGVGWATDLYFWSEHSRSTVRMQKTVFFVTLNVGLLGVWTQFDISDCSLFPGLPRFHHPLEFTIIRQGRPGSIHHVSGSEVDIEGVWANIHIINLKTSFLPVKRSSYQLPMCCFGSCSPPYIQLVSTWRHQPDECSQTFPVFAGLPLHVLCKCQRSRGGLGTRLSDPLLICVI